MNYRATSPFVDTARSHLVGAGGVSRNWALACGGGLFAGW